ncbi:ABC transporter substrate-binding protein [Tardiphaga sp. 866_E4_N2_1]|jgi:branched-chain amino acid transport system substrate-binding protein|uniref:ABC transporter substrate-binding protein n=1 Tax=unclassified Tardiphaga TaxID=2631404 RepID=UPI003F20B512
MGECGNMRLLSFLSLCLSMGIATFAVAQPKYSVGASDTEIRIGNFVPYSGPSSAYGVIGRINGAYFRMLNEAGGINGRRITWLSYDDAYSPAKAVEQARRLVEGDEVLLLSQTVGAPSNAAVMKYLNSKKVPHILLSTGGTRFGDDPTTFPWTVPLNVPYQAEGRIYATWITENHPGAKIAILYANDDYGRDIYRGVKDGLTERGTTILAEANYDNADPTIDSQIVKLKASGADLFVNFSTPKFAAMAIRKIGEIGWRPVHVLNQVSQSTGAVMRPAGLEYAQGIISAAYIKDPMDESWDNDPGMNRFASFLQKYAPDVDRSNGLVLYAYGAAQTLEYIIRRAGNDLTRENIMRVTSELGDFAPASLLPGITLQPLSKDHFPIRKMQMMRFEGDRWQRIGSLIEANLN